MMPGILLGIAFFSVLLVIYWLTEKPTPTQLRKSRVVDVEPKFSGRVLLEPPKYIGTIDFGVKNALVGVWCPAYGQNGCKHGNECVGAICAAADRGEAPLLNKQPR